jgi:hypothetical protein
VHAVGSFAPLIPGSVGCVVIRPDGSRYLARVEADPLAPEWFPLCMEAALWTSPG